MYVSENKSAKRYLIITLILIAFGMIYEHFSYSVYSPFMAYAFIYPFLGGYLYLKARQQLSLAGKVNGLSPTAASLHAAAIGFLACGSLFKGILDIYGTTNRLGNVYWIVGIAFLTFSVILSLRKAPPLRSLAK